MRRRLLVISVITFSFVFCLVSAFYLLDHVCYSKHSNDPIFNQKGYRGSIVSTNKGNKSRIAVFGDSTVFGYGVLLEETMPYLLEKNLKQVKSNVEVVNLGMNSQGLWGIYSDIDFFKYINYDTAILYTGHNNISPHVHRGLSGVFAFLGYYSLWPVIFSEKGKILKYGANNLSRAYHGDFNKSDYDLNTNSTLLKYLAGTALEDLSIGYSLIDKKLSNYFVQKQTTKLQQSGGFKSDIDLIKIVLNKLLEQKKEIYLVRQSNNIVADRDEQIKKLLTELPYKGKVKYIDLSLSIDVGNKVLAFPNGKHLTKAGNTIIANELSRELQSSSKIFSSDPQIYSSEI
ncbi:MAG: hypothetical protein HQK52_04965 [Oligoflexia bacterium]|nr:hypothetical protein [Oligoflexia bacterium]